MMTNTTSRAGMRSKMDDEDNAYPPDAYEAEDAPGMTIPQPRSAAVRQKAQGQIIPPTRVGKNARKMKKEQTRILSRQKQRSALEARKAGATYKQIAEAVGYADASSAHRAVKKAFGEVIQEPVMDLKPLQIERLNHMLLRLWPRIDAGDESAMRTALAVMDKIDALEGTNAAQRVEVTSKNTSAVLVIEGDKDDYIAAMKRMSGIDSSGNNIAAGTGMPALPGGPSTVIHSGPQYPPGMGGHQQSHSTDSASDHRDVVEGELVADPSTAGVSVGVPADDVPPKKKFSFGVDPLA